MGGGEKAGREAKKATGQETAGDKAKDAGACFPGPVPFLFHFLVFLHPHLASTLVSSYTRVYRFVTLRHLAG